jgi:hypothetical protein
MKTPKQTARNNKALQSSQPPNPYNQEKLTTTFTITPDPERHCWIAAPGNQGREMTTAEMVEFIRQRLSALSVHGLDRNNVRITVEVPGIWVTDGDGILGLEN